MIFSFLQWYFALAWAVFATVFYYFVYRKSTFMSNIWLVIGVFAFNFFFFAYGVLLFIILEYIRSKRKQNGKE